MQEKIYVKKSSEDARGVLPFANSTDAGYDLCSNVNISLEPNKVTKVNTGVAVQIPENTVGLVWDKSSIASLGIKTLGGVIDSGYRGEIIVLLINLTTENILIEKGRKVAQLILQNYIKAELVELKESENLEESDRGDKGFGSSGK